MTSIERKKADIVDRLVDLHRKIIGAARVETENGPGSKVVLTYAKLAAIDEAATLIETFRSAILERDREITSLRAALTAAPASAAEPVNSGLQNVNPARFEEALSRLYNSSEYRTTVTLRPTLADTLIAALFEQAEIIDRFKRTSAARELAFQAAVGGGDLTIDT